MTETTLTLKQAALQYASLGLAVFPLQPGAKTPLTSHGCYDATTDQKQISDWWEQYPDANIGGSTGQKMEDSYVLHALHVLYDFDVLHVHLSVYAG